MSFRYIESIQYIEFIKYYLNILHIWHTLYVRILVDIYSLLVLF